MARTATVALSAALADPRVMPMSFAFEPAPARYVRLMQSSTSLHPWAIAEVKVGSMD